MRKILVTGGQGFIGRPCLDRLVGAADEVHVLSRAWAGPAPAGVRIHHMNLLDGPRLQNLVRELRPTHLLHLAWITTPGKYWTAPENLAWVAGGLDLLRAFAEHGGQRAVMAGTCAEYSWAEGVCYESTTPLAPSTLYGVCKNSMRAIAEALSAHIGLQFVWGRFFFLYGPREHPHRLVPSVITSLLHGKPARCTEGTHLRDFLFVEDAADALVALLNGTFTGTCNIASGRAVAIRDVVWAIAEQLGRRDLLESGALGMPVDEPKVLVADIRRLRENANWFPHHDLASGLAKTIHWWKTRLRIF